MSIPRWAIVRLGAAHDRTRFASGDEPLDRFLKEQAVQAMRDRACAVFVATSLSDPTRVVGYYTLSQFAIALDVVPPEIARKLPKYSMLSPQEPTAGSWGPRMIPATLLGCLAVSKERRGQKLGELLLMDALKRSLDSSSQVASTAVVVDAKDEAAAAFYKKYGFIDLPNIERRLFLPMGTIENLFAK